MLFGATAGGRARDRLRTWQKSVMSRALTAHGTYLRTGIPALQRDHSHFPWKGPMAVSARQIPARSCEGSTQMSQLPVLPPQLKQGFVSKVGWKLTVPGAFSLREAERVAPSDRSHE